MQQIEDEVRQFVVDNFLFDVGNGHFSNTDSFMEKGLVDSMGILRLITFVEEKYAVPVRDEDLVTDNWDSVQRITTFVKNRLQASTQ